MSCYIWAGSVLSMTEAIKRQVMAQIDRTSPVHWSVSEEKPQLDTMPDKDVDMAACEQGDNVELDFPDGGLRAWLMVVAAVCVTASSFGVVNSFVRYMLTWQLLN